MSNQDWPIVCSMLPNLSEVYLSFIPKNDNPRARKVAKSLLTCLSLSSQREEKQGGICAFSQMSNQERQKECRVGKKLSASFLAYITKNDNTRARKVG